MDKRFGIEGSAASKMIQLMRKHGANKEVGIEVGTVVTPLPNVVVRLDSDGLELDRGDLVLAKTIATTLTANLRVILISDNNSQKYFIIDEAVE
jgi:hypothetical protein